MKVQGRTRAALAVFGATVLAAVVAGSAQGTPAPGWGAPVNLGSTINTGNLEGCPAESPDGKSLYFASDRSGGLGSLDIWVSHRANKDAPWEAPVDLPYPVNSNGADFCPTPVPGNGLFFVSSRGGYCGGEANTDIYFTKYDPATKTWRPAVHLPCDSAGGPNTDGWAQGPSYFAADGHGYLYFSSGPDTSNGHIYVSERRPDGSFGPATPVAELNSSAADIRPNVSADGREVVFESTREGGLGQRDIWTATRQSPTAPWSEPVHLPAPVNSDAQTHRATLSRDGKRLYFGSDRSGGYGGPDIYVSTRT